MSAQSPAGGEGREQDRLLPVANIQRIMRRLLPADEKISKDAKEVLQESLSRRGVRFVVKLTPSTRDAVDAGPSSSASSRRRPRAAAPSCAEIKVFTRRSC